MSQWSRKAGRRRGGSRAQGGAIESAPRAGGPIYGRSAQTLYSSVALFALVLATGAVYAPVRHFAFVNWDDGSYTYGNPNVLVGLTWRSVIWAFTTSYPPYWHPITWVSHLLDVSLFGMNAGLQHVPNVLMHLATTVLVFFGLRRTTGRQGASLCAAALFALHPAHVESVAWVAERKDVLSTLLWACTIWAYLVYAAARSTRWPRYLLVVALYSCALMAKPMVLTLPIVLLLLDRWPLGRFEGQPHRWRRLVVEKLPLAALSIGSAVVTLVTQTRAGELTDLGRPSWALRLVNAAISYVAYVGKLAWPTDLAALYPYRWALPPAWAVTGAVLGLITASALVVRARRTRPYLFVGWFWYLVTLVPVIGLVQSGPQSMADRFVYVPSLGLFVMAAWGASDLAVRWRAPAWCLAATAVALAAACAVAARRQVGYWSDSVTLWEHATAVTRDSYLAYENLGSAMREEGRLDEALAAYRECARLAPGYPTVYNSLGLTLTRQGRLAEAVDEYQRAVTLDPAFAEAQSNLGNALAGLGRSNEAVEHYRTALSLDAQSVEAHVGLADVLLNERKGAEAAVQFRAALALNPSLGQAHDGLGAALAMQGNDAGAVVEYLAALRIDPGLASAHANLALILAHDGRTDEAIDQLLRALAIDPSHAPWHYNLAMLFLREGRTDDARKELAAALQIDPGLAAARAALNAVSRPGR